MRTRQLAAVPASKALAGAEMPDGSEPRARLGLRIDVRTTPAGVVELPAIPELLLKIHTGPPVRGACRRQSFVYTHGDVDVLPAGTADAWEQYGANTSLYLALSPALLQRAAEDLGADPQRADLVPLCQVRDPQIEHIGWALEAERKAGFPSGALYTESLGLGLAVHLLGRSRAPRAPANGLSPPRLRRVTEYIEAHLDRNLSLARLAAVAGLSATTLKTSFLRATGVTVHAYVVRRRVARAQALLARGDRSVSEVALEAGFAHQSHLARWMRRLHGVTPRAVARGAQGR